MEKHRYHTEEKNFSQMPLLLTSPHHALRPDLREWVSAGGDIESLLPNGLPVWAQCMRWGSIEAVEEALALGSNPNQKDYEGRGWIWWATETGMPSSLILSVFTKLNRSWWEADLKGKTPFHHPQLSSSVAHAMACRWWTDGLSWRQSICPHGDPIEMARQNERWDLLSVWQNSQSQLWFTRA